MVPRLAFLLALGLMFSGWLTVSAQDETQVAAPPLVLTDGDGSHAAAQSLEILADPSGLLTIDDVRSPAYRDKFAAQSTQGPGFGITETAYWGRLQIRNASDEDLWIVTLPDAFPDYLDYYLFNSNGKPLKTVKTGRALPFSTRDIPSQQMAFRADISPGEVVTVYLRNASAFSVRFPVQLDSLAAFAAADSLGTLLTAAVYGFMILMALKNFLIYASLRDRNYLLLVLYIVSTTLTMALRDGRAHQLLWPNAPQFGRMVSVAAIGLAQIFLLLFSISFLDMRRYAPGLRRVLLVLLGLLVAATLAVVPVALGWLDLRPVLAVLMGLGFPTTILLAIAGPLVWHRGHPAARYYALAQTVPLIFGIADLAYALSWLPVPTSIVIVPRLGSVLMVLFLSLALSDSVHVLRRRAEEAVRAQQETEQLARQYLDAMPLGVGVYGQSRKLVYVNPAAMALVRTRSRDLGAGYSALAQRYPSYRTSTGEPYQDGEQPLYQGFAGIAGHDDDLTMEVDGRPIPLETWWTPLRNARNEPIGVISILADITEKKRAEEELKRYQSGLEELVRERTQELLEANAALVAKQRVADTLSEVATLLAAGPGPGPMLNRILELLGRVIEYRGAGILLEDGPDILMVGAAGNAQKYLGERFATDGSDPRARVYREGQIVVLDGDELGDVGQVAGEPAICRWVGLPLAAGGKTFGVLVLESATPCASDPSELLLLEAFAGQAAAAVWIAQLYALAQSNAAIAERERLARDLHDAVTQTLFSASIFAEMLPAQWAHEPDEVPRSLEKLGQLIRSALAEMRALLMELRPTALVAVELHQLIKNLVQAAKARTRINFTYLVEGESPGPLPPETQISIYRIAQELLNNVVKHSGATGCEILFSYQPQGVELAVSDNGRGFDPTAVGLDHMGLAIMQERAKAVGLHLLIDSKPDAGTRAVVCWQQTKETIQS